MYTFLKQGCVLPSVTALQILLNRTRKSKITVDGVFGPSTKNAVIEFQRMKKIKFDGIVGKKTWPLLTQQSQLKIIDTLDTTDPNVPLSVGISLAEEGADPIKVGAMCGGVSVLVSRVLERAAQRSSANPTWPPSTNDPASRMKSSCPSTVLLRMTSHGGPGNQWVSGGRVVWMPDKDGKFHQVEGYTIDERTNTMKDKEGKSVAKRDKDGNWKDQQGRLIGVDARFADETILQVYQLKKDVYVITPRRGDVFAVEAVLGKLRGIFVKFGSVELHGCSVGAGSAGQHLLDRLAKIFGVPVTAALKTQMFGRAILEGFDCPFRFQGPVVTAVPFGGSLKGWSKIVADAEHERPRVDALRYSAA